MHPAEGNVWADGHLQMVELEETFITQLQRVADTYKREVQEQQGATADLEARLRGAQLAAHQAQANQEKAQKALQVLQAHPPPVDVGTETDGQLQQAEAALEAQRAQSHALKRRILELQVPTVPTQATVQQACIKLS